MTAEEFDFVELNQSEVSDEVISQFDCGNRSMTEYLHQHAKDDTIKGKGVTYDAMAEGCTSLAITLTEIEYVLFSG